MIFHPPIFRPSIFRPGIFPDAINRPVGDVPSLDLAFAADKTLTARKGPTPTFTRASTGTFVGSNGLIQSAAINTPRFDHDPVTGICRGLLIEEGDRANLLARSEDFNDAYWVKQNTPPVSVASNVATAPSGLVTADILRPATTAGNFNFVLVAGLTLQNTSHTATVYLKAGGYNFSELIISNNNAYTKFATAYFNLATGQFVSSRTAGYTVAAYSIAPAGNGWYRCSLTVITDANSTAVFTITCGSTSNPTASFVGDGTSGIFLWGAQLEAGSFPTSYIPTTTTALTRSADVCSITGGDFTSFYNQSEGSFACNYSITAGFTGNRYAASIEDVTGGTQNGFTFRNTNSATSFINGAGYSSVIGSITTGSSKHILAYTGLSQFVYCKDGVVGTTTGSGTRDPSLPIRMSIGGLEGSFQLCGHIARIQYFRKRLPNAKLQALTAP